MKRQLIKPLSLCAAASLCLTSFPSSAYELDAQGNSIEEIQYQTSSDEDFTNETSVFAQIGSQYEVTIPKVIVLDGKEKKASYNVSVTGDIAGYETIYVIPDEQFLLHTKNKPEEDAFVSQDKIEWQFADISEDANGLVYSDNISAGRWSGTFWFNISLGQSQVLGDIIIPEDFNPDDFDLDSDDYRLLLEKIQKEPGLYDNLGNLIISYGDLVEKYGFNPTIDNEVIESVPFGKINEIAGSNDVIVSEGGSDATSSTYKIFKQPSSNSPSHIINTYFPETTYVSLPSSVSKIGTAAFARTSIKYIYFDNVEEIGDYAFASTSLPFSNLPSSTRYIGRNVYYDTPVTTVYCGTSNVIVYDLDIEDAILNNKPIGITLEKGYDYRITALYNFYNDVTKQSTITVDNSNILKFIPDCTLHTIACGTTTIRGTYTTKSGIKKDAAITVTVIDGGDNSTVRRQQSANYLLITDCVDEKGNKLRTTDYTNVTSGEKYTVYAPTIKGYTLTNDAVMSGRIKETTHVVFTYKAAFTQANSYLDTNSLAADYKCAPVGAYANQTITLADKSTLTCDIYKVADGAVLDNGVFTNCKANDANTQIIIGNNLTVAAGTTLTPPYRCKGLFIIDTGTFTNNGTISMTARGAKGKGVDIPLVDGYKISATGGAGGAAVGASNFTPVWGKDGSVPASSVISCGGGGSGSAAGTNSRSGAGGSGTSFSGGAGGGAVYGKNLVGNVGSSQGGAGGAGILAGNSSFTIAGGGSGNGSGAYVDNTYQPAGTPLTSSGTSSGKSRSWTAGTGDGTGGLIVVMANEIVSSGKFTSKGVTNKLCCCSKAWQDRCQNGGASGGGCIVLISKKMNITGTHSTAGGARAQAANVSGANAAISGGSGGAGTYKEIITNNLPF